ncbi:MAG: DUF4474 domain-containing protein [Clostridia bacterium]|nr:DUF4474 domain-containing protein [Clostridia bacterium]
MHFRKRLVAMLLALTLFVTGLVCVPASAAGRRRTRLSADTVSVQTVSQYRELLEKGYPTITTEQFLRFTKALSFVRRLLTGRVFSPEEYYNLTMSEDLSQLCAYICANSGLDIEALLTHMPETKQIAELVVDTFGIDTVAFREKCFEEQMRLWDEGRHAESNILFFLGVFFSIMESCEVYTIPTEDENVVEVVLRVVYRDGGEQIMHPNLFINTETGEAFGADDRGMVNVGFNCSIYDLMTYATVRAWQREFGFMLFYDLFCYSVPIVFAYNTRRFKFDYAGKEWMIQIWKGKYVITNGCEVGIYNRPAGRIGTYYDCASDEEMMTMSMELWHGDELILQDGPRLHWWLNAFKMGKTMYLAQSMTLKFTIEMPDQEMVDAFLASVKKEYHHDVTAVADGLTVSCEWAAVDY